MPSQKQSRRALKVWERLRQWYGTRLTDQYGAMPPEDWVEVINRTDDDSLSAALTKLRTDSPVHPPTLGQLEKAIPPRRRPDEPSIASMLNAEVMKRFGSVLCAHQLRGPWSFYHAHSDPLAVRGVVISACEICGQPSHRVRVEELVGEGAAA